MPSAGRRRPERMPRPRGRRRAAAVAISDRPGSTSTTAAGGPSNTVARDPSTPRSSSPTSTRACPSRTISSRSRASAGVPTHAPVLEPVDGEPEVRPARQRRRDAVQPALRVGRGRPAEDAARAAAAMRLHAREVCAAARAAARADPRRDQPWRRDFPSGIRLRDCRLACVEPLLARHLGHRRRVHRHLEAELGHDLAQLRIRSRVRRDALADAVERAARVVVLALAVEPDGLLLRPLGEQAGDDAVDVPVPRLRVVRRAVGVRPGERDRVQRRPGSLERPVTIRDPHADRRPRGRSRRSRRSPAARARAPGPTPCRRGTRAPARRAARRGTATASRPGRTPEA